MTKPATTTPDPEFNIPSSGEPKKPKKSDPTQAQAAQQPGGGGAPGTGQPEPRVDLELLNREEAQQSEPDSSLDEVDGTGYHSESTKRAIQNEP
jgi:hypothetical protein